jgi:photosystem II stability/assembly factor-like uncharacterized protein
MKKHYLFLLFLGLQALSGKAQWVQENSAFTTPGRGIASMCALNANTVWASGIDTVTVSHLTYNVVTQTTNGGTTWTQSIITGASGLDVSNVTAISADTAWVAMGNPSLGGGSVYRTNDAGTTWTQQNNTAFAGANGYADEIYFYDKNNGVCVGDSNAGNWEIYTTVNGGGAWTRVAIGTIPPNLIGEVGNNNAFAVFGNNIWFGTSSGRIYKSTDKGMTWTVATTPFMNIVCLAFKDANNGLAENNGSLIQTTNGGTTWTAVTSTGPIFDGWLCFVPGSSSGFVCSSYGTGNSGTAYSNDNGVTWSLIDTLNHGAVAFVSQGTGWCGGFNASATVGGMYKWSNALGIQTQARENESFTLFPNPMTSAAEIAIRPTPLEPWNFEVFDLTGKEVFKTQVSGGHYSFERNNLPQGMYFYKAVLNGNTVRTGKIIMN